MDGHKVDNMDGHKEDNMDGYNNKNIHLATQVEWMVIVQG